MADCSRKDRSVKKSRNSVGCLLLRRSRRRANSEPPKAKRHDRQASCSSRTVKANKIAREERYRTARNSESDSGFLSFESDGVKRDEMGENVSVVQPLQHTDSQSDGLSKKFKLKNGRLSSYDQQNSDLQSIGGADIVNLNENYSDFYENDLTYDSDSMSVDSTSICFRCRCMPRLFKSRNSRRSSNPKRTSSLGSQSLNSDESIFDLRTNVLTKISDLQDAVTESEMIDKSQCFLNLIYSEHRCVDSDYCNKVKFAALNAHLRTLIDCMPKTHCDCESKVKWTNCILNQAGYISQRRNAICETTELSKKTVCRAVCNFMTLKALLRYDLL